METTNDIIEKYLKREELKKEMEKQIRTMMPWDVDIMIARQNLNALLDQYKNISDE